MVPLHKSNCYLFLSVVNVCLKAGLMWQSRSVKLWQTGEDCAGRGSNTSSVDLRYRRGARKFSLLSSRLLRQSGALLAFNTFSMTIYCNYKQKTDWVNIMKLFLYLLRKKPFGQDVISHRRPSIVTTVMYVKSPCSFLCPGGGFQQLRDTSFK